MKPNLFIVGAPKCGTTAWVSYLAAHPDIFFPEIKEPHFFSGDLPRADRVTTMDGYMALFRKSGAAKVVGEGSVRYLNSSVAARNIREFNPEAKIIIFLRDHADYLASWHGQLLFNGDDVVGDFAEAWLLSGDRARLTDPRVPDYRNEARFAPKVRRFVDEFPPEQVRVFHFRDWTADPRAVHVEILRFLGLSDDGRTTFPPVNEARHARTGLVAKLVRNPPAPLRAAVGLVRRLTGRQSLGLANFAMRLDSAKGNRAVVAPELKQEIRDYFRDDEESIQQFLWKPER